MISFRGRAPQGIGQLVNLVRFGFTPLGSAMATGFRHEIYMLTATRMVRFGFMPISAGGAPPAAAELHSQPFMAAFGRMFSR